MLISHPSVFILAPGTETNSLSLTISYDYEGLGWQNYWKLT